MEGVLRGGQELGVVGDRGGGHRHAPDGIAAPVEGGVDHSLPVNGVGHGRASWMGIAEGSPVAEIQRARFANGDPTTLETSFVSLLRCPEIDQVDFSSNSLYQVLDTQYGLKPSTSRRTLEMAYATSSEAQLLQITPGAPLFLMKAVVHATDGPVMEFAKILFRADRFRFQI